MILFLGAIIFIGVISYILIKDKTTQKSAALAECKLLYLQALSETTSNEIDINTSKITTRYKLSQNLMQEIDAVARKECIKDMLKGRIINDTLSPIDYQKVYDTAKRINVVLDSDQDTIEYINSIRKHWSIENEELPPISVGISLQKDEICYYKNFIKWYEQRKVTTSVSYSGFSTSFKIAKGVRYRVGSYTPHRVSHSTLVEIDSGHLYVTNKRLIFMGSVKNTNIKYQNILAITPYSDGVGIEKDSGKSPVLICSEAGVLARIISKLNN